MKRFDVVLVGSGISCLTAAAILSQRGKSVCVLEQYVKPGGYLHSFSRFGHRFETGSHYVGALDAGQPFRTLLEWMGVYDESHFVPLDDDAFDVFEFPEFRFEFPKGYAALERNLNRLVPGESAGIAGFLEQIRSTVKQFPTYSFNVDYDDATVLSSLSQSLGDVIRGHVRSPRLEAVLSGHCALHGVRPDEIPFGLHALVLDSMVRGAYGFRHGGDALAKRFVDRIRANGGEVRTKARVQRLRTENRLVTAVELESGEALDADWVISGAHPKATFRLVDAAELSPAFHARLARITESSPVFGIYGSSRRSDIFDPLKNYYFFSSADPRAVFDKPVLGRPPGVMYASCPRRDGAPAAETPITLHSPAPHDWFAPWAGSSTGRRPAEYKDFKGRVAADLLDFLDAHRPGAKDSIVRYESSSSLTNLHFNGSEDGSAYGLYHSFENTGARALGPRTHVRNLLLTGQNCLLPGLLASTVAGLRTAGALIGIKPLIRELEKWGA